MFCCYAGAGTDTAQIVVSENPESQPAPELKVQAVAEEKQAAERAAEKQAADAAAAEERERRQAEEATQAEERRLQEERLQEQRSREEAEKKQAADAEEALRKEAEEKAKAAEAKAAAPKAEPEDGVPMTFRVPGSAELRPLIFKNKPLGMEFNRSTPAKVVRSFGNARALGVQEGWELMNIAGTAVDTVDFNSMLETLKAKIEPLKQDGLILKFKTPDSGPKNVLFPARPLGMDFNHNSKPIKVTGVSGVAKEQGVRVDWELINIGGADVEDIEFGIVLQLLKEKISALPIQQ